MDEIRAGCSVKMKLGIQYWKSGPVILCDEGKSEEPRT